MRSMSSAGVRLTRTACELSGVQYSEGINFDGLKMIGILNSGQQKRLSGGK